MANNGVVVSWRVPSKVGLASLRLALTETGHDSGLVAALRPRNALRRALRNMSDGRVVRQFLDEDGFVFFQLTREHLESTGVRYAREAEVSLDLATAAVKSDDPGIEAEAKRLLDEHLDQRLTGDLTRLVQRIVEKGGGDLVPIREAGGAYYVPEAHAGLVHQLADFLERIGGKLRTFAVAWGEGANGTQASVAEALTDHLTALVAEFRESCADVSGDSRKDTVARRFERVAELKAKLENYRGLLTGSADAVGSAIASAEAELLAVLARTAAV